MDFSNSELFLSSNDTNDVAGGTPMMNFTHIKEQIGGKPTNPTLDIFLIVLFAICISSACLYGYWIANPESF